MRLWSGFLGSDFLRNTEYDVDGIAVGCLDSLEIVRCSIPVEKNFRLALRCFGRGPGLYHDGVCACFILKNVGIRLILQLHNLVASCRHLRIACVEARRYTEAVLDLLRQCRHPAQHHHSGQAKQDPCLLHIILPFVALWVVAAEAETSAAAQPASLIEGVPITFPGVPC